MTLPTLPPSWSAPTTCVDPTDIWAVVVSRDPGTNWFRYFFGVPASTPTGDCLPPYYDVSTPYIGQTCPPGYSSVDASATTYSELEVMSIYCCPG